jgi:CRP-like cAMP-binding protein
MDSFPDPGEVTPDGETMYSPDTRGWVQDLKDSCLLFASLPERVADILEQHMHEQHFAIDEYLIRQGQTGDSLMVIRSGIVQIGSTDERGNRHWIARSGRGQVLGEMSLLTGEPRTADVIASRPVRAMVLPVVEFHRLAKQHPEITLVLSNIVARRLGAADQDVLAGKTLGGWLFHGRLGKGGMSVVYHAEDRQGRQAALKMMSHRLVYDETACRQFQREADIVQSFDHPNIVRMHDRFAAFHTYFLAMEYCEGRTLDVFLKNIGRLPEAEVRKIVGQLAAGLHYAHAAGVIHRDIKPSNVMVMKDGTIKLMDFGLARPVDEIPSPYDAAIVGTPAYMAPEQLAGEPLTVAADFFGLGAVIWEMLTGRRLFGNLTLGELLSQHSNWTPPSVRERIPHVSDELTSVVERCLARSPLDRRLDLQTLSPWAAPLALAETL